MTSIPSPTPTHAPTHARTRIKICGFTREADVADAVAAGADALGFNLYNQSPRHVSLARAQALIRLMPPFVTPVLLFVNARRSDVQAAAAAVPHAVFQFHGDETPEDCEAPGRPYLRAVRMGAPEVTLLDSASAFPAHRPCCSTPSSMVSVGAGRYFDWSQIPPSVPLPVVLSGGLNPANVTDGVVRVRPWAVDVSSGVEVSKGVKSAELMRRFCQAVRQADDERAAR